jgi:hypothetical protein
MKTYYNKIKLIVGIFVLAILAVSCLPKEESMGDAGQTLVKLFPSGFTVTALDPVNTPQTMSLFEVRRDLPSAAALAKSTTVVLSFDADTTILKAYNDENGTDFIPLPPSLHSTTPALSGTQMEVVFGPGEYVKTVTVTVPNAFDFDFSKSYALTYSLVSVSGEGSLSAGSDPDVIVQVLAKNEYDGIYEVTEVSPMIDIIADYLAGNYPFKYKLVTTGQFTCDCIEADNDYPLHPIDNGGSWSYYGSFCPQVEFAHDGSGAIINMTNYWGNPAGNTRGCLLDDSQTWGYDANTKTIRVKYYMTMSSAVPDPPYIRTTFDELWTLKGPR